MRHMANLAQLDQEVEAALKREQEDPTITEETRANAARSRFYVVSGMRVNDEEKEAQTIETARQARREAVQQYLKDRDFLKKEFQFWRLPILPKRAWDRICQESGLYRFKTDDAGRIVLPRAWFDALMMETKRYCLWMWPTSAAAATFLLLLCLRTAIQQTWIWPLTVFPLFVAAFAGLCGVMVYTNPKDDPGSWHLLPRIRRFRLRPWEKVLRDIFPEGESLPPDTKQEEEEPPVLRATLVLPDPPEDVAHRLIQVSQMDVRVAAEPAAIGTFDLERFAYASERPEKTPDKAHGCPIAYVVHGSAVAIVGMYGTEEFRIEQAVVNRVLGSEHLI